MKTKKTDHVAACNRVRGRVPGRGSVDAAPGPASPGAGSRYRQWTVLLVDHPIEGERFLSKNEILRMVAHDLEAGVTVTNVLPQEELPEDER